MHRGFYLYVSCLLLAAGLCFGLFVWQSQLASFADDSVSYLVMARYLSPFHEPGPLIKAAFAYEKYPPVFPALLAITDGAYNLKIAHAVIGGCFLVSIGLLALLARQTLTTALALGVTLVFLVIPGSWYNLKGILSEYPYIALTLLTLYWQGQVSAGTKSVAATWILGGLLAAVLLTRTIGVALILAYGVVELRQIIAVRTVKPYSLYMAFIPLVLPIVLAIAWYSWRPAAGADAYVTQGANLIEGLRAGGFSWLTQIIVTNLQALYDAWVAAFILYWDYNFTIRQGLITLLGLISLVGLGLRLKENRLDAWYVLFYLAILSVWPFPGQMYRLILPVIPILLLHAVYLGTRVFQPSVLSPTKAGLVVILIASAVSAPAMVFLYERTRFDVPLANGISYSNITQFYTRPSIDLAKQVAGTHIALFEDMLRIERSTSPGASVMWYTPNHITLLANRQGHPLAISDDRNTLIGQIERARADYVFLSAFNPRDTDRWRGNGVRMWKELEGVTQLVWHRNDDQNHVQSVLLKVDKAALQQERKRVEFR